MDLSMMLSGEKRDEPPTVPPPPPDPPAKRSRADPAHPNASSTSSAPEPPDNVIAAASSALRPAPNPHQPDAPTPAASPYSDLQRAVHNALENKSAALTTSDKVALALEVLRARQLELDLAQARNNIEALVTKTGSAPRTLRAVIPASTVKGMPVGTPIEISSGKFLLSPTTNDPQALFLTLELQNFGSPHPKSSHTDPSHPLNGVHESRPANDTVQAQVQVQVQTQHPSVIQPTASPTLPNGLDASSPKPDPPVDNIALSKQATDEQKPA